MTLIEVTLGAALMGLVLLSIGFLASSTSSSFREGSAAARLEERAHRTIERIAGSFAAAAAGDFAGLPAEASTVTLRRAVGWDAGGIEWSGLERYAWEVEEGELLDGADNNGNGLVDEGVVAFYRAPGLPGETRVVQAHGVSRLLEGETANLLDDNGNGLVDERGLSFEVQGDVVTIRLTLLGVEPDGGVLAKTVQTSVRVRN